MRDSGMRGGLSPDKVDKVARQRNKLSDIGATPRRAALGLPIRNNTPVAQLPPITSSLSVLLYNTGHALAASGSTMPMPTDATDGQLVESVNMLWCPVFCLFCLSAEYTIKYY
jgi:hypothetical protein